MNAPSPSLPSEKFTMAQLKEARKEFNELRGLLQDCQRLSAKIGQGKCDFDGILACLYAIEKNPMYNFLAANDASLKSIIDMTFYRLRNVGGIISLSMAEDAKNEEDEKEKVLMDEKVKELDKIVEDRKLEELSRKRNLEVLLEEEDDDESEGDDEEKMKE